MDRIKDGIRHIVVMRGKVRDKIRYYLRPTRYDSTNQRSLTNYFGYCLNKALESKLTEAEMLLMQCAENANRLPESSMMKDVKTAGLVGQTLEEFKKAGELVLPLKPKLVELINKKEREKVVVELLNKLIIEGNLEKYLNMLYKPQRDAIIEVYGLCGEKRKTQAEVARIFNIKEKTICSRISRGTRRLQDFNEGKISVVKEPKVKEPQQKIPSGKQLARLTEVIGKLNQEGRLEEYLNMLFDSDKETLKMYCGLFNQDKKSQKDIAAHFNVNYRTVGYRLKRVYKFLKLAVDGGELQSGKNNLSAATKKHALRNVGDRILLPKCIVVLQKEGKLERVINLLDEQERELVTGYYGLLGKNKTMQIQLAKDTGIEQSIISRRLRKIVRFLDELAGLKKTNTVSKFSQCIVNVIREDRLEEIINKLPTYNRDLIINKFGLFGNKKKTHIELSEEQGVSDDIIYERVQATLKAMEDIRAGKSVENVVMVKGMLPKVMDNLLIEGRLETAIRMLNELERFVIARTFGLFGSERKTQVEIADELGVKQCYISRKLNISIKKLEGIYKGEKVKLAEYRGRKIPRIA